MKILVVLSRFPYPLDKGDKVRAFNQIKQLSVDNEIYLFCLSQQMIDEHSITKVRQYCKNICVIYLPIYRIVSGIIKAYLQNKPLQVGFCYNKVAQDKYNNFVKECQPDRVYCQLLRMYEYVKDSNINLTLDFQDCFSLSTKRRAEISNWYLRLILQWEATALRRYEDYILSRNIKTTIISETDKSNIHSDERDKIKVIQNGVDFSYFSPSSDKEKKYDIAFVGRMSYPPNINAVQYLIKQIMPLVWKKYPNTNVLIAGVGAPHSIVSLASDNVTIAGHIDDICSAYSSSNILVAPMQIGAGLQNKLLEAMAMKLPCITSEIANASLKAKNREEIIVANTPDEYANSIIQLLSNPKESSRIADNGYKYVTQNFSWEEQCLTLQQIINEE